MKSILHARKLILMGAKWRVGDGSQIKIYGSNWLPGETQGRVVSPQSPALRTTTILALIHPHTYGWNSHTTDNNFLPFEAKQIKSIPLGLTNQLDILYWPGSRDGSYSVSTGISGYVQKKTKKWLQPQTQTRLTAFGSKCGKLMYLEKSSISHGKLVQMRCQ